MGVVVHAEINNPQNNTAQVNVVLLCMAAPDNHYFNSEISAVRASVTSALLRFLLGAWLVAPEYAPAVNIPKSTSGFPINKWQCCLAFFCASSQWCFCAR